MSPSNRTEKRERAVKRQAAAGLISPEKAAAELAKLKVLGPRFVATWTLPTGGERTKTFDTAKKASAFEAEQRALVRIGAHQDENLLRASIAQVLDFYLAEKMHRDGKPRGSFRNARAIRDNIITIWGQRFTLEAFDRDPELYVRSLRKSLEAKFETSTAWNHKVTLRAAIQYWVKRKRLRLLNPVDAYDWPKPKNTRKQRITFEMHLRFVREGHKLQGAWLAAYFECGWETGWRGGEIQDWRAERFNFKPAGEDFPRVKTLIEKQGGETAVYEEKPVTWRVAELVQTILAGRTKGRIWPVGRTAVDRWVRKAMDQAGGQDYRFHDYRRSIKKRMEDAGIASAAGAAYTGHGEDMHEAYTVHLMEDMQEVLRKLEGAGHGTGHGGHGRRNNAK